MRKTVLMLIAAPVIHLTASQSARAADIVPRGYPAPAVQLLFMHRQFDGPAVTSAETSVGRGQTSTFPA